MQDFRNLEVWRLAHELTLDIYRETADFPSNKRYGLTSQMRRSAASVGANLAEGCGRGGDADFGRFVQIALGSASELEYHLVLAHDLKFLTSAAYQLLNAKVGSIQRMLTALLKRLKPRR